VQNVMFFFGCGSVYLSCSDMINRLRCLSLQRSSCIFPVTCEQQEVNYKIPDSRCLYLLLTLSFASTPKPKRPSTSSMSCFSQSRQVCSNACKTCTTASMIENKMPPRHARGLEGGNMNIPCGGVLRLLIALSSLCNWIEIAPRRTNAFSV
jgi:hypothetical protein